jgi:Zn-dependent protease with chaperone function
MLAGIKIDKDSIVSLILLIFLFINVLVIVIVVCDMLFGFTIKFYTKTTVPYLKVKNYNILTDAWEDLKLQYNKPTAELRVSDAQNINAYAVGNLKKQYVVITKGIVSAYLMENPGNLQEFVINMKCIMGHEMSHLINKDYLPGLLLQLNELAANFVSRIIIGILNIFLNLLQYIPFVGRLFAMLVLYLYKCIDFVVGFFHKYVLLSVYKFLQLKISRTNEFRCDYQSSLACGGGNMAETLSVLGDSSYTSIFSTHPAVKPRMRHVLDVQKTNQIITPDGKNNLANTLVIIFMLGFPFLLWHFINMKGLLDNYDNIVINLVTKYRMTKVRIFTFLNLSN